MNNPIYEYHDPIPRMKKLWKKFRDGDFDYVKSMAYITAMNGVENITDITREVWATQDFNASHRYIFVDRPLSAFLDTMHINEVQPDYIKDVLEKHQGAFVLVWGDGSTCLCDISFVDRETKRRSEISDAFSQATGIMIEWRDTGVGKLGGFSIYISADGEEEVRISGIKSTSRLMQIVRDKDIGVIMHNDYVKYDDVKDSGFVALNKNESDIMQKAFVRLIKTFVYIKSYPQNLKDGIVGDCALPGLQPKHIKKTSLTMTIMSEHRSISSHLRRCFFRLYPIRKNGERKSGLVFVKSTIVKGSAQTAVNNKKGQQQ